MITTLSVGGGGIVDDDGNPNALAFSDAVQMWVICQRRASLTVDEAARTWNATPEVICDAVDTHPSMWLDGDIIRVEG